MPANTARGETTLEIDGRPHLLCLTLGALAELEGAFDVNGFSELGERLAALTASDLITVLSALTKGGGAGVSSAALAAADIDPRAAVRAVAEAFRLALGDE